MLRVHQGRVEYVGEPGKSAKLSWPEHMSVSRNGQVLQGNSAEISASDDVEISFVNRDPQCSYSPMVSPDRMQAALRVQWSPGYICELVDQPETADLFLEDRRTTVERGKTNTAEALSVLHKAGIVHGVTVESVRQAIEDAGKTVVVALGTPPKSGINGSVEQLIDFDNTRFSGENYCGVVQGTAVLRWTQPKRGAFGSDVLGVELESEPVEAVALQLGEGVLFDPVTETVVAGFDGIPDFDESTLTISLSDTLVLERVDSSTGDIYCCGSVHVLGDVDTGRAITSMHSIRIDGGAEKATLESGDTVEVSGALINCIVRAGGDRAVAASVYDVIETIPQQLESIQKRAIELRAGAAQQRQDISHGLAVQLLIEKYHRTMPQKLVEAAGKLQHAGHKYDEVAQQFIDWKRLLATSAINNLTPEHFAEMLREITKLANAMQESLTQSADLSLTYAQSSELEATGIVTITGKGLVNSKVVAWGGVQAMGLRTSVRGGSIVSHGNIEVRELGSPGGATLPIHLAAGATLKADKVYAGTFVSGPALSHRFIADRSHVTVKYSTSGPRVDSLAA